MGLDRNRFTKKDAAWVDWLRDEPLPQAAPAPDPVKVTPPHSRQPSTREEQLQNTGSQVGNAPAVAGTVSQPGISIQVNLPKLTLPKFRIPWAKIRQYARLYALVGVVCLVLAVGLRATLGLLQDNGGGNTGGSKPTEVAKAPSFAPLVPQDKQGLKTTDSSNGQASYDATRSLYTFKDTMSAANIVVSQQAVPEKVQKDKTQLSTIAETIYAKDKFTTAYGDVYTAYDQKTGIQRLVFMHKDKIVFIQSDKKFETEDWKFYVEALR